jgi:hypothetical protein
LDKCGECFAARINMEWWIWSLKGIYFKLCVGNKGKFNGST